MPLNLRYSPLVLEEFYERKNFRTFLMATFYQSSAGTYIAKHEDFIKLLSPKIQNAFISHGICVDSNDCRKKKVYFFSPGKEALYITLYSMTDLKIIREVIGCILDAYEENSFSPSIELHVFKEAHLEGIKIFNKEKPILTISVEERK